MKHGRNSSRDRICITIKWREHVRRIRTSNITKDMGLATLSINCGRVECRQGSLRLGAWLVPPPHIHTSTVSTDRVGCSSVGVKEGVADGRGSCEPM